MRNGATEDGRGALRKSASAKSVQPEKKLIADIDRKIGLRLRSTRLHMGLTQHDLAKMLGVSFQQVQKYERGLNRLPIGAYATLRRIISLDLSDVLDLGSAPVRILWAEEWPACDGAEELSVAFMAMHPNHRRLLISIATEFQRLAPVEKGSTGLAGEEDCVGGQDTH